MNEQMGRAKESGTKSRSLGGLQKEMEEATSSKVSDAQVDEGDGQSRSLVEAITNAMATDNLPNDDEGTLKE